MSHEQQLSALGQYLPDIIKAATEYGEDPAIGAAIVLRESGAGYAPGYNPPGSTWGLHADGHGHGLCGIDDRWHKEFCSSPDAANSLKQFRAMFAELHANRAYLRRLTSMPGVDGPLFERCVIAGYNAGPYPARRAMSTSGDPDKATTGGNYSADIMARAATLRERFPQLKESK